MKASTTRIRLLTTSAAAAILLASAGTAFAQDGPRRGPNDTLRGPSVNDRAMPRDERFGESMMEGRRQAGGMANLRFMMASIGDLKDHDNQRLRLTEEQGAKIQEIQEAYQKAMREYMAESREQTQNLRERVRRASEEAGNDPEAVAQIRERARQRAQEIRENAPNSERAEAAIWKVLTQPQQRFVKAEIERRTDEMMRDRQMQRDQRNAEGQRPGADAPAGRQRGEGRSEGRPMGPDAMGPEARGPQGRGPEARGPEARGPRGPQADSPRAQADPDMRRWQQLFTRIQKLSPQAQERLFNMINQTVQRAENASQDSPGARGGRPDAGRPEGPSPDAQRRERRGPGADAPRPTDARPDARPDRPRRGPQPGSDRD